LQQVLGSTKTYSADFSCVFNKNKFSLLLLLYVHYMTTATPSGQASITYGWVVVC